MEMPVELGVRQDWVENQAIKFSYLSKSEKIFFIKFFIQIKYSLI